MKRVLVGLLLLSVLLSGCTSVKKEQITIIAPKGAPALALLPLLIDGIDDIKLVDGTDVISAQFINAATGSDIIIAPINLGAALITKGKSKYKLYGIITWGNLYVVADSAEALNQEGTLAMFGQAAVPQKIWDSVSESLKSKRTVQYFNSVADVQVQLLTKKMNVGLLAEPAVSAAIAKAKTAGFTLQVVADLQAEWKKVTGLENYPQAAIFVKEDADAAMLKQVDLRFSEMKKYVASVTSDTSKVVADVKTVTPEVLGVASGEIIASAWAKMNIKPTKAADSVKEITEFLKLFGITDITNLSVK